MKPLEILIRRSWIEMLKLRENALRQHKKASQEREEALLASLDTALEAMRLAHGLCTHGHPGATGDDDDGGGPFDWQVARAEVIRAFAPALSDSLRQLCIACEDAAASFCMPCTHQSLCIDCWKGWLPKTCPFCKCPVTEVVVVQKHYYSL